MHGFWMKNTLIPLDMIWIDSDLTVVDIQYAVPCESDPCTIYTPAKEAIYVLEVNGDKFDQNIIGKQINIYRIKQND